MAFNTILRSPVGADVSRPSPMYRHFMEDGLSALKAMIVPAQQIERNK